MRILGIDPGSISCGYGIVEVNSSRILVVDFGVIKPRTKSSEFAFLSALKVLYDKVIFLINEFKIDEMAIETQFYHKNAQTLMKLTQARTSIELSAINSNLPVFEYSPREIKLSVTGKGNATKKSVRFMVNNLLQTNIEQKLNDASDALAVALCHLFKKGKIFHKTNSPRNWREFVEMYPSRIISS